MRLEDQAFRLSASDLMKHLACKYLTDLERAAAEGKLRPPYWHDPALELLQKRGLAHEAAYVEHLASRGLQVIGVKEQDGMSTREQTINAMRAGADAIVQAEFRDGAWMGKADVLLRVSAASELGNWSYEAVDTKLAQETRGGSILQLCLYSDLLGRVQGRVPIRMHIVRPGQDFPRETFRFDDFGAYYRAVQSRLERVLASPATDSAYPYPVAHCDICRWWKHCDAKRHSDDHLCLVAGIRSLHVCELERQGVNQLAQFAESSKPLREKPKRGSEAAFHKSHHQARVQLEGRKREKLVYEFVPPENGRGFMKLPEPAVGDVFLDIESDRFVEGGGLEYLFGFSFQDAGAEMEYRSIWALSRDEEKAAFQALVDFLTARWQKHPRMHVYHFSPYEPASLKRLMSRHATRDAEVDQLLRGGRFIDLHAVARQGLRASVERYSLKNLEHFCGFKRAVELPDASAALRRMECALELGAPGAVLDGDRVAIEAYNRDDCLATAALRGWLEERRVELEGQGAAIPRPEERTGEASDAVKERDEEVQQVFDGLLATLPQQGSAWVDSDHATWLLAHLLDYFRREDKCAWWEFFRLHELEEDELRDERKAVFGLEFKETIGGTTKCPVHRYRFPVQEVSIGVGEKTFEVGGEEVGSVAAIDSNGRTLDIKKRAKASGVHPIAVIINERVVPQPLDSSLLAIGRSVLQTGVDGDGAVRAGRDLLLKRSPRLRENLTGGLRGASETAVDAAVRLVGNLDEGVLAIQGPPGTGKTYAGARMILAQARAGKRVGVTAVSHKVIRNLLEATLDAARESGFPLEVVHKVSEASGDVPDGLSEATKNEEALAELGVGKVVGGTAWLWARDDAVESADVLFVDEAGQMSLAHTLAASRAAKNIVLLGDPQQLEQPHRGAHPEGAEIAALNHMLDGRETIAEEKGLFLDETWRLHPSICTFTSEVYYEGRLRSRAELRRQVVEGDTPFAGSGLFYVPTSHEWNQNYSAEEVEVVFSICRDLLARNLSWTNADGVSRSLRPTDILVVAPFNVQVAALTERLREVACSRVGTVDRFQGQEAPIVVYSMTSSSVEDAPRGMSFIHDPHRMNVATSRAQGVVIVVGTPRLMEPECRTPPEIRWANGACRFRELAQEVRIRV